MDKITSDAEQQVGILINLELRCDLENDWWAALNKRALNSGYSLGKQYLVDLIKEMRRGKNLSKTSFPLEICMLPCGGSAGFATLEGIPDESYPCPCGNPNHWLIKYEVKGWIAH